MNTGYFDYSFFFLLLEILNVKYSSKQVVFITRFDHRLLIRIFLFFFFFSSSFYDRDDVIYILDTNIFVEFLHESTTIHYYYYWYRAMENIKWARIVVIESKLSLRFIAYPFFKINFWIYVYTIFLWN